MGEFDDHVAIIGDWMPPSPSPRALFSTLLGDDVSLRMVAEPTSENKAGFSFPGPVEHSASASSDQKDGSQGGAAVDQTGKFSSMSEQRMSSRGGLMERMAARAGFNAPRLNTESIRPPDLSQNLEVRSPYLTIPPGLSPTTLLDSPVFLTNSLVQPSPTTGKLGFLMSGSSRNATVTEFPDKSKENCFQNVNTSSFAFRPILESGPPLFFGASNRITSTNLPQQPFPSIEVSVQSGNTLPPRSVEHAKSAALNQPADFSRPSAAKDTVHNDILSEPSSFQNVGGGSEHSPPLDEQQEDDADQRGGGDQNISGAPAEDGYNWRKYGQKQVKGSEYPRSYYKCTHPNCPVKKKVERSQEGHITEIIYKGAHNHPKPPPNRRSALGSSNTLSDLQVENSEQVAMGADGNPGWTTMQKGNFDWRHDNLEETSSAALGPEYGNGTTSLQAQNGSQLESGDGVDGSSTFSNDEDDEDRGTHGSVSLGYDEGDESESKRRKIESYATDMSGATRAIREPRVVVQTTSEVDILDDGYRWRKYGQKVVKGNPNPRSYYKCTSAGCTVRKHVERASHDLKSVITTYEGKHNHDVPAARNSSHVNSGISGTLPAQAGAAVQSHVHRPEPSQLHNCIAQFERPPLGSFALPGRPPLGPTHGFGFGMNQQGLPNMTLAGLGPPNQGKIPALPVHPYLGQPRPMNEMGRMLPKGEPKMEPMSDPGLNLSNGSSVYHMSRLPLGP
ncbi:probable WRKY transcription factor 2 isoform X1 [Coffea eugenioides]|uniref:Probable WRKY transcription factor 2 isoform X1 n=1 Tax=Coffea arabica TaxID=13443 RepID=A0A6P6XKD5_COFAR|nr:probable WRKY transcription factor 2 isoform X1 [Coffea eugenioides]XP_027170841.1 probable WRKY transcription factor 2 isoform X1 [Coffea eugenioides]XP_027170842.1 probable WRKY transcription factor 2 isoform X1 [Coffea eugenioides]XP_027170844.1 probable WRKY transcription factor 2 isoform X1 [Coffea eugenioides]XP_027170845.1 probable WRKY transcription factor 2 isoform X1 [Coffea eugenioides]